MLLRHEKPPASLRALHPAPCARVFAGPGRRPRRLRDRPHRGRPARAARGLRVDASPARRPHPPGERRPRLRGRTTPARRALAGRAGLQGDGRRASPRGRAQAQRLWPGAGRRRPLGSRGPARCHASQRDRGVDASGLSRRRGRPLRAGRRRACAPVPALAPTRGRRGRDPFEHRHRSRHGWSRCRHGVGGDEPARADLLAGGVDDAVQVALEAWRKQAATDLAAAAH